MIPSLKPTREEKLYKICAVPRDLVAPAGSRDFQCKAFVWRDFHMTCLKGLKGSHHTNENKLKVNLKWN